MFVSSFRKATSLLIICACAYQLTACKQEETRPSYETQVLSRAKAVQQAERKRAEAQQEEAARNAAAGGNPSASTNAASSGEASSKPATPSYLPPSEQGAEVEITETPLDGGQQPAAKQSPSAAAPPGPGGNMPSGVSTATPSGGAPPPPPAPSGATGSAGAAAAPKVDTLATPSATAAARTSAEQGAALNQELRRKLDEFDALMRKAQQNAARERAAGGGNEQGAPGGQGARLEAPPEGEEDGAGGAANRATGLGRTPDQSGETRGTRGATARGDAELRLPETGDDDVVARQLREAAERESDPVLREKLWDEYRKYKGG